jgi:hypothetical protein
MALIGNYSVLTKWVGRQLAGSSVSNTIGSFNKLPMMVDRFAGGMSKFSSHSAGYVPPYCRMMARKGGGMATFNTVSGAGAVGSGNLAGGLNGEAPLSGSGDITNAALGLILSAVAALSGSGSLTAAIIGRLEAAAALAGGGDATASLGALAGLASALTGSGVIGADIIAKAALAANIVVTGDVLNSANVAEAVWGASAAANNEAGTMGEKLNDAGSGSNPWTEVIESGLTAAEVLKLILAVSAGKSSGGSTTTITFRDTGDTKDRVLATVDSNGNRTAVTLDAS